MSYDEFWNKDYRLVESYKLRHDRELDYNEANLFKIYKYMREIIEFKIWSEGDPKKRGKPPKLTEKYEPISDYQKYLQKLEEDRQKETDKYLKGLRGQ